MNFNQHHTQSTTPPRRSKTGLFSDIREDLFAALLEFIGTVLFLLLGLGGIQASSTEPTGTVVPNVERVLYISTCMGFSLLVSAWIFFRITGALFNPNVAYVYAIDDKFFRILMRI
jgi:aquaporin rerated protein, other eukaryote